MPGSGEPRSRTLADRIDYLIQHVHPPGRGPYTYEEICEGIRAQGGSISAPYLHQLHRGRRDNPTADRLAAIARFFGVSPSYFYDDEEAARQDEQIEMMTILRDNDVRNIALRAVDLTPRTRQAVIRMIEELSALEERPKRRSARRRSETDHGDS